MASKDSGTSTDQTKLSWSEYFMAVARLSATRSKDAKTKVCCDLVRVTVSFSEL